MGNRSRKIRGDSGRYPAVLVAGGILFYGLPLARAAEADQFLALSSSLELERIVGAAAVFRDDAGSAPALALTLRLAMSTPAGAADADTDMPSSPAELPLRLANILVPRSGTARQPRWKGNTDSELVLGLTRATSLTPLEGRPAPVPAPDTPSRPTEFPLRLAQVMLPRSSVGKQPRWGASSDPGLNLGISQEVGGFPSVPAAPLDPSEPPRLPPGLSREPAMDADSAPGLPRNPAIAFSPPPAQEEASGSGFGWTIPPIRWGGTVGYVRSQQSSNGGASTTGNFLTSNFRAASYIYAPWLASISGGLGVTSGMSHSDSGQVGASAQTTNGSKSVTGYGNLDVLPSSRYPFSAYLSRSDTRASGTVVTNDSTTTRLGLRQSYRTEDGKRNLSATYDHSTVASQGGASDTVDALGINYSLPIGIVNNNFAARLSVSERPATGEGTTIFQANSNQSAQLNENMSVQAYANLVDNDLRYAGGKGPVTQTRGQYIQLGASGSWQPEFEDTDDLPLSFTGGLNYLGTRTSSDSGGSQAQQMGGNLSAYYRVNPNLTLGSSGSLLRFVGSDGQTRMMTTVNGNFNYTGDPLKFGNFSYNWNTGGNANWMSAAGSTPSTVITGLQAAHSLGRTIVLGARDSVSVSLSQQAAAYQNQTTGGSNTLTHNVAANYYLGLGETFTGTVTSMLSDVMTTGITAQHYRNLSIGLSGSGQLSARSGANANLIFNWSDQTIHTASNGFGQQGGGTSSNQRMTLGGSASYNHQRFMGVPGLRYTFGFTADTMLRDERLFGNADASANRARFTVDNRLDYRIGRLDTRTSYTVSDTGGKKNALLFFQVTRQIGSSY